MQYAANSQHASIIYVCHYYREKEDLRMLGIGIFRTQIIYDYIVA